MAGTREKEAGAGVLGAGAAQGAYQQAGYSTKHYVDRHTRKGGSGGVTADQIRSQDKALKTNKKKFGMHLPQGSPGRDNVGYHRAYPAHLPYSRPIRILSHTHEGRLGNAVGATITTAGGVAAVTAAHRKMNKSFGVEIEKKSVVETLKSKPVQNTRGENTKAGAALGAGMYGALGGGLGAAHGRSVARGGIRALHEVGAAPSKARAAGIVTGHAVRTGGRVGAVGAAVGAGLGAATGVTSRARRKSTRKESPMSKRFGVDMGHVSKADKPNAAPSSGRQAAGTVFGAYHSAVAGKKGRKLGAVGSSVGHGVAGGVAGAGAGAGAGAALGGALSRSKEGAKVGGIVGAQLGQMTGVYAGNHRAVMTNSAKGRYKKESK